ncbi:MAG: DPP IV N-terminal domain-containing protein, partial [Draconibacterium sp.]|nr:DPP IV N-terminal domain-containing protein [Draconibacterium sp.]
MFSKKVFSFLLFIILGGAATSQDMSERYKKAEQLLPKNISKLTRNVTIRVNQIESTSDFWYKLQTEKGERFYYFDGEKIKSNEAFDHIQLAKAIQEISGKEMKPDSLKLQNLRFKPKKNAIEFSVDTNRLEVKLEDYTIKRVTEEEKLKKNQSESPDKKWIVEVRDYNLFLKEVEIGKEFQLTDDGIERYEFATPLSWYKMVDESVGDKYNPSIYVKWSDDSKKFVCSRLDRRKVGKLYMYQSLPDSGFRAKVWSYERALPGEDPITSEYYVFDVEQKAKVKIDLPPFADFTSSIFPTWFENNEELYFSRFRRGYKTIDLFKANATNGSVQNLVADSTQTMVEYQTINCKWLKDNSEFFWTSERDGWNHIYRYNNEGKLLNQVTKGEYVVREIVKIDEEKQLVYFVAGGHEAETDPYFRFLYSVDFSGNDIKLLTKENCDHQVWIPEKGDYFIDTYSRINLPGEHVVRSLEDGSIISRLASASTDSLVNIGWKYPEPFKVRARDGITALYGLIYYPSDFDKNKKYPVIDATYTGPQAVRTPKSFARGYSNYDRSIAELGFIVITIDGLGSAWRSKAFHDVSYRNLGDIGAEDHIGGIKQLAKTRPWFDLERVGIYGHSAGGYDAAHALLTHPEFYKVGVSSAGNHDHRIAKAWWPEQYMGMPGEHYDEQSNFNLAKNLKGKLLLVHGDMDNNVNPASSLRLAAELIKHNKDFELIMIPNRNHGLADHPYFIR